MRQNKITILLLLLLICLVLNSPSLLLSHFHSITVQVLPHAFPLSISQLLLYNKEFQSSDLTPTSTYFSQSWVYGELGLVSACTLGPDPSHIPPCSWMEYVNLKVYGRDAKYTAKF